MSALKINGLSRQRVAALGGIALAVLAGGIGVFHVLLPRPPKDLGIEAHCSVVAGKDVTSETIRITCGLDKTGIQAVVTQALAGIDVGALIDKARKGQLGSDSAAIEDLAARLGVSADQIIKALETLGKAGPNTEPPADRLVAIVTRSVSVQTVLPQPAPANSPPQQPIVVIPRSPAGDAEKLVGECAAVAGGTLRSEIIDLQCGPSEADIKALVALVISEADLAALVKQAMSGMPEGQAIDDLANRLHLTRDSIVRLLAVLSKENVPAGQVNQRFAELARKHVGLVLRLSGLHADNPAIRALRGQAMDAIEKGDYRRSETLLAAAELAQEGEKREVSSPLAVAARTADRGERLLATRDYLGAAERFADAAGAVPDALPLVRAAYLLRQAATLETRGSEVGDNGALRQAVLVYVTALDLLTQTSMVQQNAVGSAMTVLGKRDGNRSILERAIEVHQTVLEMTDHTRMALFWSMTQKYLGDAFLTLGEQQRDKARLQQAVEAYRAALEGQTRERNATRWAAIQSELAWALFKLGDLEGGTAKFEEAAGIYNSILAERPRETDPSSWAEAQVNLGAVLSLWGKREVGTARLEQAVVAYHGALEEWTRQRAPLQWANTQNNLGIALSGLGERESGTARLKEAVAAYRAALEEWTRERVPLYWAMAQGNLGGALLGIGDRERGTASFEEAVKAFRAALEEETRERMPLVWAQTQTQLCSALTSLGTREVGTEHLEAAIRSCKMALEENTVDRAPLGWANTQDVLAFALKVLGERQKRVELMTEALAAARASYDAYDKAGMKQAADRVLVSRNSLEQTIERLKQQ